MIKLAKLLRMLLRLGLIDEALMICDFICSRNEVVEQDAFTPAGIPTDEPFRDLSETWPRYERWSDTVRSVNPIMTMTPPAGVTGH